MSFHVWLIFGFFMIVIEIFTPGFFAASLGISAILTSVLVLLFPEIAFLHWLSFIVFNIIMFAFIRQIFLKYLYKNDNESETNVNALIGKRGVVTEKIDDRFGYVKVYGDLWKAVSENETEIAKGEKVEIISIDGNKVIVKKHNRKEK